MLLRCAALGSILQERGVILYTTGNLNTQPWRFGSSQPHCGGISGMESSRRHSAALVAGGLFVGWLSAPIVWRAAITALGYLAGRNRGGCMGPSPFTQARSP